MRIHDDDCDVEMLEVSDFMDEEGQEISTSEIFASRITHLYAIEMAKLSVLRTSLLL